VYSSEREDYVRLIHVLFDKVTDVNTDQTAEILTHILLSVKISFPETLLGNEALLKLEKHYVIQNSYPVFQEGAI
jgi:hypothetical protein